MTSGAPAVAVLEGVSERAAQTVLIRLLDELASLLLQLQPSVYTAKLLPGVSGSVGEHVRHILDHVTAFAVAREQTVLTYDHRERGTAVEADSVAALRMIMRLRALLDDVGDGQLDRPMLLSAVISRGCEPMLMRTTRRRELASVISHTVHHQALIAVLLAMADVDVPDAFGRAPTTPLLRS